MDNVQFAVKGNTLTITVDISKRGERSTSGKTIRVASTCGNVPVPDGKGVVVGLNCYTKE